jgi:hypothetical protein
MDKGLQRTFQIVRRLETSGEEVIASRDDLAEAQQLASSLSDVLRGDFFVRRFESPTPSEADE